MNYIPAIFPLIVSIVMIFLKWYVGMSWNYLAPSFVFFLIILIFCHFNEYKPVEKLPVEDVGHGIASKIMFDGHSYVIWSHSFSHCIMHDPDCACIKTNERNRK